MVAAVVQGGKGKEITLSIHSKVAVITVGRQVGRRKLKKVLTPFGNDFVFGEGVNHRGITVFNDSDFREKLLFSAFYYYVRLLGSACGKVGVFDPCGKFIKNAVKLLDSVSEMVIVSEEANEELLKDCLKTYGTCPDICIKDMLLLCDTVFCPVGLTAFRGVLFGKGGVTACGEGLQLPFYCVEAVKKGVDPIKIAALLDLEKDVNLNSLMPENVLVKETKIPIKNIISPEFAGYLRQFEVYSTEFLELSNQKRR